MIGTADDIHLLLRTGWSALARGSTLKGYRYRATSGDDPVRSITVKTDRIVVRAGGPGWTYTLDEPAQGSVALRLRTGSVVEWCARVAAKQTGRPPSTARTDRVDRFVGQPKSSPGLCPAP